MAQRRGTSVLIVGFRCRWPVAQCQRASPLEPTPLARMAQRRGALTFRSATAGQGDQLRGALCSIVWPSPPLTPLGRNGATRLCFGVVAGKDGLQAEAATHPGDAFTSCPPPSCMSPHWSWWRGGAPLVPPLPLARMAQRHRAPSCCMPVSSLATVSAARSPFVQPCLSRVAQWCRALPSSGVAVG